VQSNHRLTKLAYGQILLKGAEADQDGRWKHTVKNLAGEYNVSPGRIYQILGRGRKYAIMKQRMA
jgi:hypothetical protein